MVNNPVVDDSFVQQYQPLVHNVATYVSRRFNMIDRSDVVQECWLWLVEHPNKVKHWSETKSHKEVELLVRVSLRNAAMRYCVKEKARIEGYSVDTIFWYSKDFIKELLPAVLTSDWRRIEEAFNGATNTKAPSEAGDWMAYAVDIRKAYDRLSEDEQKYVFLFYAQDVTGDELKEATGAVTAAAARMSANRAINKMVEYLGGTKPAGPDRDYKSLDEIRDEQIEKENEEEEND